MEGRDDLGLEAGEGELTDVALGGDDEVEGLSPAAGPELGVSPEDLANPPFDTIADDGIAHLFRGGDAESTRGRATGLELVDEEASMDALTLTLDAQEVATDEDPEALEKTLVASCLGHDIVTNSMRALLDKDGVSWSRLSGRWTGIGNRHVIPRDRSDGTAKRYDARRRFGSARR